MQMGQSHEAFLQWKHLVSLLFGCTESVSAHPSIKFAILFIGGTMLFFLLKVVVLVDFHANNDQQYWGNLCPYEMFMFSDHVKIGSKYKTRLASKL